MGKETGISWTDHTFNPWIGCTKVSAGCDNCYAETQDHRWGHDSWGKGKARRVTSLTNWKEPVRWNRDALAEFGRKARTFCASLADVMDDEAPEGARERLWELIDATPNLDWQLLTKRPQRYMRYLPKEFKHANVWLGITAENQEMFDARVEHLMDASIDRGTLAFVSYEPALGPLTLSGYPNWNLDWLIFGGESGANRRTMETAWAENIKRECEERGTKFFMKQMSAATPTKAKELIPAHLISQAFPDVPPAAISCSDATAVEAARKEK